MTAAPPGPAASFGFPKEHRLLTSRQYDDVFKRAKHRLNTREFLMLAMERDASVSRVGTVVSKKVAGNAVERNRIRRLIKETFRLSQLAPGLDVVVVARSPVRGAPSAEVGAMLDRLWRKLASRLAR